MRTRLLLIPCLCAPALAAQTTIHVPQDHPAIQAAIAAASPGDTVLVAPGTYVEQIDFLGKAITVTSSGGAKVTTIDSQGHAQWLNQPIGPVVRMIQGEGASSVLEGFTITGSVDPTGFLAGFTGIWCDGLAPTVRNCVVTGNKGALGAGVFGDALLQNCTIKGNTTLVAGEGGGLFGQPTLIDCKVTGNHSAGRGGGLYADGPCTVTGTVFDANIAGNGPDGYSGGAVFGPATLIGCQVTNNSAHHYFSGGPPDEIGTGVDGAVALIGCTVADNFIEGGPVPGETSGGIKNVGTVRDSILWNNQSHDVALSSTTAITYSIVGGGYPGTGNLALNPAFDEDYLLSPASPAIDAGDPASPADPDGTRADMGAYYFPQFAAGAVVRNGTGLNPLCYTSILKPYLGSTWVAKVDATLFGFPGTAAIVAGSIHPIAPLLLVPFGELLIDPTPLIITTVQPVVGGIAIINLPVPLDASLGGITVATQAVVAGTSLGFGNAIDLTLGI
jgi:hypothetical protein